MTWDWEEVTDALESGDTDLVNTAIDSVGAMDLDEQIEQCPQWVENMSAFYVECDDGYARQALVRIANEFTVSLMPAAINRTEGDGDLAEVKTAADALRPFLLETITDTDGRVRRASIKALKSLAMGYEHLGEEDTVAAIAAALREVAESVDEERREHLIEAAETVEFYLQPADLRMVEGLLDKLDS